MAKCSKDYEIELDGGKVVDVTVKVEGYLDDTKDREPEWFIDSWAINYDEEGLSEEEVEELQEKMDAKVFEDTWDFEAAAGKNEESDEEEDEIDEIDLEE